MDEKKIELKEAEKEVELISQRLALLHLSYAKAIIDELGEEKGEKLVLKAINNYGKSIGEKRREEIEKKGLRTDTRKLRRRQRPEDSTFRDALQVRGDRRQYETLRMCHG